VRAPTAAPPTGPAAAPEELSWDEPVRLHAESRAPRDDEPGRGFLLRLHADPACPARLVPEGLLVERRYAQARAEALCPTCTGGLLAAATSSVVHRLREAERTLLRLQAAAADGPMPREVVHCRALRYEAQTAVSAHPEAPEVAARVTALAGEVAALLVRAMTAYDRSR
jgi:hypothetical protein